MDSILPLLGMVIASGQYKFKFRKLSETVSEVAFGPEVTLVWIFVFTNAVSPSIYLLLPGESTSIVDGGNVTLDASSGMVSGSGRGVTNYRPWVIGIYET